MAGAQGAVGRTGMLGTSRLANGSGANPIRARASGLMGSASDTASHIGELLVMVVVELAILAVIRKKFIRHHGG